MIIVDVFQRFDDKVTCHVGSTETKIIFSGCFDKEPGIKNAQCHWTGIGCTAGCPAITETYDAAVIEF